MKAAVMLSISPKWCSLIASGEKTIEVRKTRPKMEPPFKCYIYQTLPKYGDWNNRDGKVVGEFICSAIVSIYPPYQNMIAGACLSAKEVNEYAQGRQLYCWCITDIVMYDVPMALCEFKPWHRKACYYSDLGLAIPECQECTICKVEKAPQSWCYVVDNMPIGFDD